MADPTWSTIELPILEALRAAEIDGVDPGATVRAAVPDDVSNYREVVADLIGAGYVDGQVKRGGDNQIHALLIRRLKERGRRAIGQWPDDPTDAFIIAIERRIEQTDDEEERTRLRNFLKAAGDVGKGALGSAIVAGAQLLAT